MMHRLGMLVLFLASVQSNELRSTEYLCSDNYAEIKCPNDSQIVIQRIINQYKHDQCGEFDSKLGSLNHLETCIGIVRNDQNARLACNGEQTCHLKLKQYNFKTDISEANCNFTSNYGKIFYSCIPNFETQKYVVNSYDICDNFAPAILENVDRGFIHSPYYPDYYSNNRNCIISIKVPFDKRLVIYLMRRSMEDKSIFQNLPKDYVGIEDGLKYFGYSNIPEIIYDGNDRETIFVKFRSDWITTQLLRSPKGFLIFFELFPIHETVTEKPLISTTEFNQITTTATKETSVSTNIFITTTVVSSKIQENISVPNIISEKINGNDYNKREENRLMTIITLLIGIIGVLILVIFGLLFSFRKQSNQQSEEDTIYDMNDSKSVHSSHYNDEYQNVSIISTISLNKETPCKSRNLENKLSFNQRLGKFYKNLNKTLNISRILLKNDSFANTQDTNSTTKLDKQNIYLPNEFNLNESDLKLESSVPLDRLKFFKSSENLTKRQNNKTDDLNRSENLYVTIQAVKSNSERHTEDGKLEIYEVNFDENFAYLTPSSKSPSPSKDRELDFYHSINDFGNDYRELLNEHMKKTSQCLNEDIYSTPSNEELKSNGEACRNLDNSVINLLNHENDETNA